MKNSPTDLPKNATKSSRASATAVPSAQDTDDSDQHDQAISSLQSALHASQSRYHRLVQGLGERFVVFSYGADSGELLQVSAGFEGLFGQTPSKVLNQPWQQAIPWAPGEEEKALRKLEKLEQGTDDNLSLQLRFLHPNGAEHTMRLSVYSAEDDNGQVIVEGLIEDITEHKLNQQRLQELTVHDPLTGLFNQRYLDTRLAEEIQRAQRYGRCLALLHIDLDQLKQINDTHGHDMGDRVLKSIAAVLQNTTRPADLAARLDDDQFVLVLPETSADTACDMGGRLCQTIAACGATLDGEELPVVRASIGVAAYPDHATTPEDMMASADAAMHQSKLVGGNRVTRAGID